jgi:hypothetical protein
MRAAIDDGYAHRCSTSPRLAALGAWETASSLRHLDRARSRLFSLGCPRHLEPAVHAACSHRRWPPEDVRLAWLSQGLACSAGCVQALALSTSAPTVRIRTPNSSGAGIGRLAVVYRLHADNGATCYAPDDLHPPRLGSHGCVVIVDRAQPATSTLVTTSR